MEQKSCLVPYGKHFIRYLGPYLWSRISATDKKRLMLDSFRNKDLTVLIDDACANCNKLLLDSLINLITILIMQVKVS